MHECFLVNAKYLRNASTLQFTHTQTHARRKENTESEMFLKHILCTIKLYVAGSICCNRIDSKKENVICTYHVSKHSIQSSHIANEDELQQRDKKLMVRFKYRIWIFYIGFLHCRVFSIEEKKRVHHQMFCISIESHSCSIYVHR